jgi:hypothetical protein
MNRAVLTTIGFLLAGIGFLAIMLSIVGVQFTFLAWLDSPGANFGFVMKIVLILAGFIILAIAQTDFKEGAEEETEALP